jgi:hypothetical protein
VIQITESRRSGLNRFALNMELKLSRNVLLQSLAFALALLAFSLASVAAQTPNCVPLSNQQLIIYRTGSLSRAFKPLVAAFTCQTGIQENCQNPCNPSLRH